MRHLASECGDGHCVCWRWPATWRLAHLVPWRRQRFNVQLELAEAFGVHVRQVRWVRPARLDLVDELDARELEGLP